MSKYSVDDIRNLAFLGHAAAGKTSLADALLYQARAVDRRGSVDDGSSVSDYDDEEKKRKHSLDSSLLHLDYKGKRINIIDSPGYPDFLGAALGALYAVDNAVVVISAPAGIQVNTRRLFKEAGKHELARIIVINKLDGDNIKFEQLLNNVRETFGKSCVLFNIPVGVGPGLSGVVNVINPPAKIPANCAVDLASARSQLIDAVVECDDALMEKYLLEGTVTTEELLSVLPKAMLNGNCIPIFCTSVKKDIGIHELLEGLCQDALSPRQGKPHMIQVKTGGHVTEVKVEPREDGELHALVFKSLSDKFVGNLSFLRIFSGKLVHETPLVCQRSGKAARSSGLLIMQGKSQATVNEAIPGDIVAVAKVEDLHIGDTIGSKPNTGAFAKPSFPTPMFGLAVEPKARGDEQKISGSLHKIAEEDPTFRATRDAQTKELVITGMSQLHLDVVQARLKRRFELEIITHEPKIPYRETIAAEAEGMHRHKKQSGGRGQFGEVHLRVYPLPRTIHTKEQFFAEFAVKEKFEKIRLDHCGYDPEFNFGFIDTIVGGTIPNQFVPAVQKGCKELLERGALGGYRMQDVAVEVYFGKYHDVDSSEQAFKTAGRIAFKNGFLAASPALLEPIVDLEVTIPQAKTGDVLGLLNTKRARIENQETLPGDLAVIKAKAPLAEMTRLNAELSSLTGGQASYHMDFSHYDQVPFNVQQQIVAKSKVVHDEDE